MLGKNLKDVIEKHTLHNAHLHKGKASAGAVIGKVIAELGKKPSKKLMNEIHKVVDEINALPAAKQTSWLKRFWPHMLEAKHEKKDLRDLPGAEMGKVVTRMPPDPSKYPHIGHALSFLINYMYAKKYNGKCVLRFDDTNPETVAMEYVKAIKSDVIDFLGIKPNSEVYTSEDLDEMYKIAEGLIKQGQAFVCFCDVNKVRRLRKQGKPCPCRTHNKREQIEAWENMLGKKYPAGKAVLRLKGKLKSNNMTMRDPVVFRISYAEHYLQGRKYCVWPLYDFASSCEEEFQKITHVLRSIEFGEERKELQNFIKELVGFRKQEYVQYGRFVVKGAETSGRKIRELVQKKKVTGWDDPRLMTMRALIRRGFQPETFYEIIKQSGLSKTPTPIDDSLISTINRRILDYKARRFFFIENPLKLTITGAPAKDKVHVRVHPEKEEIRLVPASKYVFIEARDFKKYKGKEVRLKNFCEISISRKPKGINTKYVVCIGGLQKQVPVIHWIDAKKHLKAEILMPNGKKIKGICDAGCKDIKIGEIVQFERTFFARLEKKAKSKLEFIFTHK